MKVGLEVLLQGHRHLLSGRRIGLVSHPAAVNDRLGGIVEVLLEAGLNLTALFGPEHGFTAAASDGASVDHAQDPQTGLPVYSLYSSTGEQVRGELVRPEPTAEMLQDVDVLVFDLQDVGVRFYTFLSTLYYLVRFSGRTGCPLMVLDRPNPITGTRVDGPLLEPGWESFVGLAPAPVVHGMTLGELARLVNAEFGFGADLTVIPLEGWQREQWFDQTGRIWVPSSPGMPRLETAICYPGTCLLEGANLSEGRGTALPFELTGAPWLDGARLARRLNAINMPGVIFRPVHFTPWAGKHRGQVCQGVQIHVVDRNRYDPLRAGLELIATCQALSPSDFAFLPPDPKDGRCHFDLLAGSDRLRLDLQASKPVMEIIKSWQPRLAEFRARREKYLLYGGGS